MAPTVLFASNCFGEDRSAALIARELEQLLGKKRRADIRIRGASLISEGRDYTSRNIPLLYSSQVPPSGGFPTRSIRGFLSDLFGGGIGNVLRFIRTIRRNSGSIRLAVVVGDVPLLWLVRRALKKTPVVFLAPAKSDYIEPHYRIEEYYMRRACDIVLTHDAFTAENLSRRGLIARFLGNPMVDELRPAGRLPKRTRKSVTVGILPGSRDEAYDNFNKILDLAVMAGRSVPARFIAALPGTLDPKTLAEKTAAKGWRTVKRGTETVLVRDGTEILLTRGMFTDVLAASDLLIGLAGTAVEQAAALGKPVVSFVGTGPQTTRRRMEEQERLLGGAMRFARDFPRGALEDLLLLMRNPKERKRRGDIGRKRMGSAGGAKRIAEYVFRHYLGKNAS